MEERHELFLAALDDLLLPLARLCLAQGLPFDAGAEALKRAYVLAAREERKARGEREGRDVSQVAVATGLSRREVTRLDAQLVPRRAQRPAPATQLYLRWTTNKRLRNAQGVPRPLPRYGKSPSFEALAQSITRHVHPRSLLEELLRRDLVQLSEDGQTVHLQAERFVPAEDDARLFAFLGANVGDHLAAASTNVIHRDRRHLEQAVFADELSEAAIEEAVQIARAHWQRLREDLVVALERHIAADQKAGRPAQQRLRIGLFSYHDEELPDDPPSTP